jgi:hypothetical protein
MLYWTKKRGNYHSQKCAVGISQNIGDAMQTLTSAEKL